MVAWRDWGTVRTFWKGGGDFETAVERNQVLINFEVAEWLHDWLPPLPSYLGTPLIARHLHPPPAYLVMDRRSSQRCRIVLSLR